MKLNILKKAFAVTAIAAAVSACVESDGNQELYADNLQPVTVENAVWEITVPEDIEVGIINLLEGVTNPEDTAMYPRDFVYHALERDEDGVPVTDENGNNVLLYEGPELPIATVTSSTQYMRIDPSLLADQLFHPHTVALNDARRDLDGDGEDDAGWAPLYSQGVYKFSYVIDNGAAETVRRDITLTITGAEIRAEEVEILTDNGFEAPISFETVDGESVTTSYPIQLTANLLPANTTYNKLTYTSSNPAVATVSASGVVNGLTLGDFDIIVSSEDGSISNTVSGSVTELSDPVGVQVINDDSLDSPTVLGSTTVGAGTTVDLDYQLLPVSYDWTGRDVTWSVSDESMFSIDQDGNVTALTYVDSPFGDPEHADYVEGANIATVTATIAADTEKTFETQVRVSVGNLLFNGNPNFDKPFDATDADGNLILVERNDSGEINGAAFEIRDDANSIDGPSLYADTTAGDLRIVFAAAGISHHNHAGGDYVLSFDVHLISGSFRSFLNAQGSGWLTFPAGWGTPVALGDYPDNKFTAETTYPAAKVLNTGAMYFNLHVAGGAQFYLDNFKLLPAGQ